MSFSADGRDTGVASVLGKEEAPVVNVHEQVLIPSYRPLSGGPTCDCGSRPGTLRPCSHSLICPQALQIHTDAACSPFGFQGRNKRTSSQILNYLHRVLFAVVLQVHRHASICSGSTTVAIFQKGASVRILHLVAKRHPSSPNSWVPAKTDEEITPINVLVG
ncbi:hypothetical protein EDB89DRAFT_1562368 [Lactarius sanguifluus]|nr:hypothetical protein EDB89DRAFT_1562368 [Lactarius sanguifluus]